MFAEDSNEWSKVAAMWWILISIGRLDELWTTINLITIFFLLRIKDGEGREWGGRRGPELGENESRAHSFSGTLNRFIGINICTPL
jgi:hypothetical protein